MTEETSGHDRTIAGDGAAVSAAIGRLEIWICVLFAAGLVVFCAVFFLWRPADNSLFRHLLKWLSGAWFVSLAITYLFVRVRLLKNSAMLGKANKSTEAKP